jgi:hypothetical protein
MRTAARFAVAMHLAAAFSLFAGGSSATTRLAISPRSALKLAGSSNVAGWRCSGTTVTGEATVAAPIEKINEVIDHVEDGNVGIWMNNPAEGRFPAPVFNLSIPIEALRCSGGRPMERDLWRALRADRFPSIEFHFLAIRGSIEHDLDRHLYRTAVGGELSLAGATRDLTVPVIAERISRTQFRLRAELPVRMTDFGIIPPSALLGLIKAQDRLTVEFNLVLEVSP